MELRSHCPINFALEHFGDKWSLLILRDLMFKEKRHYNEFLEGGEKVSTSVLSDKLRLLERVGIIRKGADSVKRSRIRYSLTPKGIALLPILLEIMIWSGDFDPETAAGQAFLTRARNDRVAFVAELTRELQAAHLE